MQKKHQDQRNPFLKLPDVLSSIRNSLNKDKYNSINVYYQDESRFGLKTFIGRCLSIRGMRPLVKYQHRFSNTYLWGSYSPITGDQFVMEIEGVDSKIFEAYLNEFSLFKPEEYKVMILDNAKFHTAKKISIPENIILVNIPPYSPELNPSEQIWQYIKKRFKNKTFNNMMDIKEWLNYIVCNMNSSLIRSITGNHRYNEIICSTLL
jgi:transposase